jgi:hypothetical protein
MPDFTVKNCSKISIVLIRGNCVNVPFPKSTGLCVGDDGVRFDCRTVLCAVINGMWGGRPSLRFDFGAFFLLVTFLFGQAKRKVTYDS